MKLLKNKQPHNNKINIASLIDVVFLLIIFFMTVSHITANEQLPINLPVAQNGETPAQISDESAIININSNGNINLGSIPVDITSLKNKLKNLNSVANLSVIIRCDRDIQWNTVRRVIKICRDCNITSLKVRVTDDSGE